MSATREQIYQALSTWPTMNWSDKRIVAWLTDNSETIKSVLQQALEDIPVLGTDPAMVTSSDTQDVGANNEGGSRDGSQFKEDADNREAQELRTSSTRIPSTMSIVREGNEYLEVAPKREPGAVSSDALLSTSTSTLPCKCGPRYSHWYCTCNIAPDRVSVSTLKQSVIDIPNYYYCECGNPDISHVFEALEEAMKEER